MLYPTHISAVQANQDLEYRDGFLRSKAPIIGFRVLGKLSLETCFDKIAAFGLLWWVLLASGHNVPVEANLLPLFVSPET